MFAPIFEDIFQPMFSDMFGLSKICQAIRFNGANNYGQLATPISFADSSEIELGFNISALRDSNTPALYGSNGSGNFSGRAIIEGNGQLVVRPTSSAAVLTELRSDIGAITANTNHVFKLKRTGSLYELFLDGVLIDSGTRTDAPMALQTFGRAATLRHFDGLIYYIRINNQIWLMDAVGQAIQPSLPAGNDMTVFNTVPEQWEQIPCNLRPSEDELLTPTITSEPQDQSVLVGQTASFTVAAEVAVGTLSFQWEADTGAGFVDIPTETSATLSLPLVALIDDGKLVRARVSANGRSAVSRAALLTVGV